VGCLFRIVENGRNIAGGMQHAKNFDLTCGPQKKLESKNLFRWVQDAHQESQTEGQKSNHAHYGFPKPLPSSLFENHIQGNT
jgi:hypothetical protein